MGQRLDSLDTLAKAADIRPDERLRDEAIAALALPDIRPGPSWQASDNRWRYAYDGSYGLSATSDDHGLITIRSVPEGREVQRIDTGRGGGHLHLSPDGQFVAQVASDSTLEVWRVADKQPVLREGMRSCSCLAFSPDSRQLVVGSADHWLVRLGLPSGQESNRFRLPARPYSLA